MSLYDIARQVTDEVLGEGAYERLNRNHPDPGVQAALHDEPTWVCLDCPAWPKVKARAVDHQERHCHAVTLVPSTAIAREHISNMQHET